MLPRQKPRVLSSVSRDFPRVLPRMLSRVRIAAASLMVISAGTTVAQPVVACQWYPLPRLVAEFRGMSRHIAAIAATLVSGTATNMSNNVHPWSEDFSPPLPLYIKPALKNDHTPVRELQSLYGRSSSYLSLRSNCAIKELHHTHPTPAYPGSHARPQEELAPADPTRKA